MNDVILGFYFQGFTEVQMSKLKKSEAFTREREREIEQVSLFVQYAYDLCKGKIGY